MFGTNHQLKKTQPTSTSIPVGNTNVSAVNHVCNLGFLMDNTLKNQSHINKLTSTFNQLMNIRRIRSKLDQETTKYIIQSLVISKLDYCNSLLLGSAEYQLNKMQPVQNMACRIVCNLRKFDHVSSSMQDLHWLKMPYISSSRWHVSFLNVYMANLLSTLQTCYQLGIAPDNCTHLHQTDIHPSCTDHHWPTMPHSRLQVQDYGTAYPRT